VSLVLPVVLLFEVSFILLLARVSYVFCEIAYLSCSLFCNLFTLSSLLIF
jgi:hypothetical protein